jgi:hypothetical protein
MDDAFNRANPTRDDDETGANQSNIFSFFPLLTSHRLNQCTSFLANQQTQAEKSKNTHTHKTVHIFSPTRNLPMSSPPLTFVPAAAAVSPLLAQSSRAHRPQLATDQITTTPSRPRQRASSELQIDARQHFALQPIIKNNNNTAPYKLVQSRYSV